MKTETLIVGGGLSGLALARKLEHEGRDFILIEARSRWGGRIHSHRVTTDGGLAHFDLGPAWFWSGQPRIAQLIAELSLEVFFQYSDGAVSYEDVQGPVQRGRGFASMEGSYRLVGSLNRLVSALVDELPNTKLKLGAKVVSIDKGNELTVSLVGANGTISKVTCRQVVLCLPPRVAARSIQFSPALAPNITAAMNTIPTWMAGHAKVVVTYKNAFWREAGLSGDAMSRRGPLAEIHDASPSEGGPYALFGFVGSPVNGRRGQSKGLLAAITEQLVRLFGPEAASPLDIVLQDWALEPLTATSLDHQGSTQHPAYGLPPNLKSIWGGKLILGSTETAPETGGYLEGALEASDLVLAQIRDTDP